MPDAGVGPDTGESQSRCISLRVLGPAHCCCQATGSLSAAFKTLQELTPKHPIPQLRFLLLGLLTFQTGSFLCRQVSCSSDLIFQLAVGRGFKEINMEGVVLLIAKQKKTSPPPIRVGFVLAHSL